MSSRATVWLTGIAVACVFLLLLLNIIPMFWTPEATEKYLKYNDIKGVDVEVSGKPYTLNFKQQNQLIGIINRSMAVKKEDELKKAANLGFSKITIYRFNAPDVILTPVAYDERNNLYYTAAPIDYQGQLKDISQGVLKSLIEKSHD